MFAVLGAGLTAVVLARGGGLAVLHVALTPLPGWSFGVAGLLAYLQQRWRRVGVLLLAVGLAWFVHLLDWTHVPVLVAVCTPLRNAYAAVFAHLLLAFPSGRLGSRWTGALIAAGYLDAVGLQVAATTLNGSATSAWLELEAAIGVLLACLVLAVLARRARRPPAAVWIAAVIASAALMANLGAAYFAPGAALASWVLFSAAFAAVPFAFLASLLGLRLRRAGVAGAAAERRRIERNLHDGAQQRLVSVAFALGLARSRMPADPAAARAVLAEAQITLAQALDELRRLSQGIHPGVLVERGLRAAIAELAWTAPIPVRLRWEAPQRLPEPVESAGYYVVAEALTNAAKHANATESQVLVSKKDGRVVFEISDNGCGGADAGGGTGLRGLLDRAEAHGGELTLHSPVGTGTTVRVELPCES